MKQHLHPGARWLFRLPALWQLIFIGVFFFIFMNSIKTMMNIYSDQRIQIGMPNIIISSIIGGVFLIVMFFIIVEVYTRMSYNRWLYEFTPTELKVESGIIWKKYSSVPYERIQNVEIHRGIIARLFGFSSIQFQTAGYSGFANARHGRHQNQLHSEGYLPAVGIEQAEQMREFVLKHVSKKHSRSGM